MLDLYRPPAAVGSSLPRVDGQVLDQPCQLIFLCLYSQYVTSAWAQMVGPCRNTVATRFSRSDPDDREVSRRKKSWSAGNRVTGSGRPGIRTERGVTMSYGMNISMAKTPAKLQARARKTS